MSLKICNFHKFYEFKIVHAGMNFIEEKQALLFKRVLKISRTELSLKTNSVQKSGGSYEDVQAHSIRCLVDAAVSMLP